MTSPKESSSQVRFNNYMVNSSAEDAIIALGVMFLVSSERITGVIDYTTLTARKVMC